ncbi:class I SAM-dependent methyltransferase [Nocardioides sp. CN2-186]|uniref:class I SAM-dependent methyltransferase n=1 Tax=Nocardioides tweenelious TaxID=3156607 RepID=UPI0032B429C5
MRNGGGHPFAARWNHNTHYFPLLASRVPASASRVLDVGCGEGTFCRYVATDRRSVVGVDSDPSVLPISSPGVSCAAASAVALPFGDGSFDAVTMTMVLHHVHPERALSEAVRVLAPGGVLLVLGFGRRGGPRDLLHEVRDVLTHQVVSRRMQAWDPPTVKADPPDTWATVRATVARALPGSTYRRLPMWRYLVEWRKPH